jgi:hypothetical protein
LGFSHEGVALPAVSEKTTSAEKEKLIADYDDRLASYESQFRAYRTWLDEDARAASVLTVYLSCCYSSGAATSTG